MTEIEKIHTHPFVVNFINDSNNYGLIERVNNEKDLTELEYYINKTMFYGIHLISLFNQLENSVNLLSNYKNNSKDEIGRGNHFTYNFENYLIRVISISDRLMQTINAVYHIGINEKDVSERIILNNIKVTNTSLPEKYKELKKILNNYSGDRNTIIHRHSIINDELFRIEKLYHPILTQKYIEKSTKEEIEKFKRIRKDVLTRLIKKTKADFKNTNEMCFKKIIPILDILGEEYLKIKSKLS
jgi:hypothetical protein